MIRSCSQKLGPTLRLAKPRKLHAYKGRVLVLPKAFSATHDHGWGQEEFGPCARVGLPTPNERRELVVVQLAVARRVSLPHGALDVLAIAQRAPQLVTIDLPVAIGIKAPEGASQGALLDPDGAREQGGHELAVVHLVAAVGIEDGEHLLGLRASDADERLLQLQQRDRPAPVLVHRPELSAQLRQLPRGQGPRDCREDVALELRCAAEAPQAQQRPHAEGRGILPAALHPRMAQRLLGAHAPRRVDDEQPA
mmetsp:Transcript_107248/g.300299  ORF Transcript_107248/g.300299 Transcript_107248/m.300299 type:complete len:252 (+) Transcript_107248:168-923(+)